MPSTPCPAPGDGIGADRAGSGEALYGNFPLDNQRGDTYGPVLYYAYVPFEALLPGNQWDALQFRFGGIAAVSLLARVRQARLGTPRAPARRELADEGEGEIAFEVS